MEKNPQSEFIPLGGMDQDSSIVGPSKNNAGHSVFETGDYRYAANLRIGSSRSNNLGAIENIISTLRVTNYRRTISLVENPDFEGTAFPWLTIEQGSLDWTYSSNKIRISTILSGYQESEIKYQAINCIPGTTVTIQFKIDVTTGFNTGYILSMVFLNGTTVIGTEELVAPVTNLNFEEEMSFEIPATCDGIGFYVSSTLPGGTAQMELDYFIVNGITTTTKPAGTNKVIGVLNDDESQSIFAFIQNSNDDDTIIQYKKFENTIYELIRWDFNWTENDFVKAAKLDTWVAFTDRVNRPRLMNIDTISDLFVELGDDFREFHIAFHKWSPVSPPVPRVYYDNVTNNFDKLKNKILQFSYQFVYEGDLKSRFSPVSRGANTMNCGVAYGASQQITSIEVRVPISILDDPGADVEWNYFNYQDTKFQSAVKEIVLAYRESELELWKIWKRVKRGFFARYYYFDGDTVDGTPIPDEDFNQQFDSVPFLAGTVEAIDNRFVFADILDELEPCDTFGVQNISINKGDSTQWMSSASGNWTQFSTANRTLDGQTDAGVRPMLQRLNSLNEFTLKPRGLYKLGVVFYDRSGWRSATYTDDVFVFPIDYDDNEYATIQSAVALSFRFKDSFTPPEWAVAYQIVRTNCMNTGYFIYGVANQFIPLVDNPTRVLDLTQMTESQRNKIVEHFDNARLAESGYNAFDVFDEVEKRGGDLKKNISLPQSNVNRRRRRQNRALETNSIYRKLSPEVRDTIETGLGFSVASRIYIDIDNWYNASKVAGSDNPMNKLYYNFREGDRVRFWGSDVATPLSADDLQLYDVPILEFTGRGIIIEKPTGLRWTAGKGANSQVGAQFNFIVEVYTPNIPSQEDLIYYETGEWYPILYPGTNYRDFAKRDWIYTSNAAVTVDTYGPFDIFNNLPFFLGDAFFYRGNNRSIYRTNVSPLGGPQLQPVSILMNPDPDKAYDFWERSNGRPSVAYTDMPVVRFKPTLARFTGRVVEESKINEINRMKALDQYVYPSEYGRIRDLINTANAQVESTGSVLLAIGEREAWSIYVNRTTLEDLSGNTQLYLSDKVLGSFNTLLGSHGTLNPESVSRYRGNVAWWDALNGEWVRYGRNGLTEISKKYKMNTWFKDLKALIINEYFNGNTERPKVISGYDGFNEELLTFINHTVLPSTFRDYSIYKGMVFSEEDTSWKIAHQYDPDRFAQLGDQLFGFKDGDLFIHEKGEDYGKFYGNETIAPSYIEPVFNTNLKDMKHWQSIAYISTDKWSVERILSEYRGNKNKQESRIPLTSFDLREDAYWAAIKADLNTPNRTTPIIQGNAMRSRAIQVLMKLDPDVDYLSLLHYVFAGFIDSPKNP